MSLPLVCIWVGGLVSLVGGGRTGKVRGDEYRDLGFLSQTERYHEMLSHLP